MFNVKNLCLISASAMILASAASATEIDSNEISIFLNNDSHIRTHTYNVEKLKPMPKGSYQIAATAFLPDLDDSEMGFGGRDLNNDHSSIKNCKDYTLLKCPDRGTCAKCPFESTYLLTSCADGFSKSGKSCVANSCQAINSSYLDTVPANKKCTIINEFGLTCYKNCDPVICGDYPVACDTLAGYIASGNIGTTASCNDCNNTATTASNCSPIGCKITSCINSSYKIAFNNLTCTPKSDTCPSNYYKSCDAGIETTVTAQLTELGTKCYQCKAKPTIPTLPILYSDLTISKEIIPGKTPIGVVFDEEKKLAIALEAKSVYWSTTYFDIPGLTNYSSPAASRADFNGKNNTNIIVSYCKTYSKSCPAAEYANTYKTLGTRAGDWYLPAVGELYIAYQNITPLNNTFSLLGTSKIPVSIPETFHWTSSEGHNMNSWLQAFAPTSIEPGSNKDYYRLTRPVIKYF